MLLTILVIPPFLALSTQIALLFKSFHLCSANAKYFLHFRYKLIFQDN